jgi:hypothetical protein
MFGSVCLICIKFVVPQRIRVVHLYKMYAHGDCCDAMHICQRLCHLYQAMHECAYEAMHAGVGSVCIR